MRKSWNLQAVLVHCSAQGDSATEVLRQLYSNKANIHDYQMRNTGLHSQLYKGRPKAASRKYQNNPTRSTVLL